MENTSLKAFFVSIALFFMGVKAALALYEAVGLATMLMALGIVMMVLCLYYIAMIQRLTKRVMDLFAGKSVAKATPKSLSFNLTARVSSVWTIVPSVLFGSRVYHRDEAVAAHVFFFVVIGGLVFLIRTVVLTPWT